jgi:hypothetical protein
MLSIGLELQLGLTVLEIWEPMVDFSKKDL